MVGEGMVQVLWVTYLTLISQNAYGMLYFALGLNCISAFGCIWVEESPRYLYGINNMEKCAEVLATIAKRNGVQDYQKPQFAVEYEISAQNLDDSRDDTYAMAARKTEN